MTDPTKLQRTHMLLSIAASVIAIVSAVIATAAYLRTGTLQKHYEDARRLEIRLEIAAPPEDAELSGSLAQWAGRVVLRPLSDSAVGGNTTLELAERSMAIVPFVRPVAHGGLWWAQGAASVDPKGHLSGALSLGESSGAGVGQSFQIVLVALPADTVRQGQTFASLPAGSSQSAVATVRRAR